LSLYALTIFLSAFLLFLVQPMLGKTILPWFGGSPAVWTACMLFFQALLVVGYVYAHGLVRLPGRTQVVLHIALLAGAVALLPITPSEALKPVDEADPVGRILMVLALSVGGPYLMLSATGPLVQAWFARAHPGRSPYRLYALSNVGSLLALLAYPLLVEPWLRLSVQTGSWSIAFVVFAALCAGCGWVALRAHEAGLQAADGVGPVVRGPAPTARSIAIWLGLSGLASMMLLAATNQICQDVASVPFLWVLPLGLYLLTFILCFNYEGRDLGTWSAGCAVLAVGIATWVLEQGPILHLGIQVGVHATTLFVCCMACHGELVKRRPSPDHLTLFYLVISLGGVLGGIFVSLVAPAIFDDFWEYPLGLVLCFALGVSVVVREVLDEDRGAKRLAIGAAVVLGLTGLMAWELDRGVAAPRRAAFLTERDFYGVFRVTDELKGDPPVRMRTVWSGLIRHGIQIQERGRRRIAMGYHGPSSGVGLAIREHPKQKEGKPMRLGVVGLGAGALAAYADRGDEVRLYEISPSVVRIAEEDFTYLSDAERRGADVETVLGDARIELERELAQGRPGRFDVLAIDAFSGDAVPMHLLTREAAEIYWQHLAPGGVLAINVSNLHLDLDPVVRALAREAGATSVRITNEAHESSGQLAARWWLLTHDPASLASPRLRAAADTGVPDTPVLLWTDDFSSLFGVLR
jgi:hypothetical protein